MHSVVLAPWLCLGSAGMSGKPSSICQGEALHHASSGKDLGLHLPAALGCFASSMADMTSIWLVLNEEVINDTFWKMLQC